MVGGEGIVSRTGRFGAAAVCLVLVGVTLFALRAHSVSYSEIKPFLPIVATIWALADVVTAILLLAQFFFNGTLFCAVLAAAYAISSLLTWPYLLAVPGLFFADRHAVGDQQISVVLWSIWHATFPILIVICAVCDPTLSRRILSRAAMNKTAIGILLGTGGFAALVTAIVFTQRALLPQLYLAGHFQPAFGHIVCPTLVGLNLAAFLLLARRGNALTTLQVWLLVAVFTAMLDSLLNAFAPSRYSLGWYAGKIETLVTATVVLGILTTEVVKLYDLALNVAKRSADLERYRLLAERTQDLMMFARQRDGRIIHANAAAIAAYGYSLDELLRLRIDQLQVDAMPAAIAEQSVAGSYVSLAYEAEQLRRDGSTFPGEVTIESRLIGGESIQLSIVRDIADRKRADRRLEELNGLMLMAEEMASIGYWQCDLRTQEVHWSDEVYRIHGVPKSQPPVLESALDFYTVADRPRIAQLIELTVSNGEPFYFEAQIRRPDGTLRDVISMGELLRAADGSARSLRGAFQDITERKRTERERDALIARVTLANQAGKIGIWDWDLTSKTIVWDQNMYALRGRNDEGGTGNAEALLSQGVHPDDIERVRRELAASIETGAAYDTEYRVVWPTGEIRHIRTRGTVVRDSIDAPLRMVGTNWDNTEVRELAQELNGEKEQLLAAKQAAEEANRVKSDFLASMSHEIRTPMNGIIGLTSLLLDCDPTLEQQRHLTLLADAGRSLLAIINDILDLSKVEAGKIELEAIALSPAGLVEGAVAIVRSEALAKGIALDIEMNADVPAWVNGDPTRLRQILLNLLTNALKFTERGKVCVSVRREAGDGPDFLRFEVADTGIGIAPERQHLLFQNFSQLDRSNARKYGGTGLGLAISRRLAEAMAGTMGVNSRVGIGSVFWFSARLPLSANVTALGLPVAERTIFDAARRILVVDDNPINQIVARGMLVGDGHDVVLVADGAQALAAVVGSAFDLVLMDMQMPVMDGIAATRHIRALGSSVRNIPIVALTANAMADQIATCREAGMNDHLAKPIDRERLRQVIAIWTMSDAWKREATAVPGNLAPAPADLSAGSSAALETDLLLELFDGDAAAVDALLTAALHSIRTDVQLLDAAITARDGVAVSDVAHRIKGTSASLRAPAVIRISASIERLPATAAWASAPALLTELTAAVEDLSVQIERRARTQRSVDFRPGDTTLH